MIKILLVFGVMMTFQASANSWIQKAGFPGQGRVYASTFVIGSKAYIGTGRVAGGLVNDFWEWDQSSDTWTQKADFPGLVRMGAVGFSINDKGYIGTGGTGDLQPAVTYNDFWQWDQSTNTWLQKNDFPGGSRMHSGGFAIGLKGYIAAGWDYVYRDYDDLWEYIPVTDSWTLVSTVGGGNRSLSLFLPNGNKVFMGIGCDDYGLKSDFWEWDPGMNIWTQKAFFPAGGRYEAAGFSFGDAVYIGTGHNNWIFGSGTVGDFYRYSISSNSWQQPPQPVIPAGIREGASGFSIGCKGYLAFGIENDDTTTYKNDLWEFTDSTNCTVVFVENYDKCGLTITPNLINSQAVITFYCNQPELRMEVFDINGRKVRDYNTIENKFIFKKEELVAGIYYFKFSGNRSEVIARKIVVTD